MYRCMPLQTSLLASYKQLYLFFGAVGVLNVCELCNAAPSLVDDSGIIPTYLPSDLALS